MKVVFVEDVPNVAQAGDVKNVANGHARNFLFPKGFAVLATPDAIRLVEMRKLTVSRHKDQHIQAAQEFAEVLQDVSLVFQKRVGAKGNIYGSVSNIAVAQDLKKLGHDVERSMIKLDEPLKQLGNHRIEIELAKDVIATINVAIEELNAEAQGTEDASAES